ncbi:hypothetical protein [Burkholderia cepacia]|uniref:hypothetical protein n=1 Tax=Burkholderia cepacia TaxID=292 RepID=UPI0007C68E97|nr:hypothetical protein [Burkholderia cepacia]
MTTTENSRADALTEAVTRTIETIKRQLDLIADRAPGDFLDKRPVVQSLSAHVRRLEKAIAASPFEQPAAAPIDESSVNDSVTLSGAQLLEALDFIAPDRNTDRDQLKSRVTIQYGEGHTGNGMYCWCAEYPEEGAIFIDGSTAVPAAPAPSPADERAAMADTYPARLLHESDASLAERVDSWHKRQAARAASANETRAEGAKPVAWLTEDRMSEIARKCEIECHAIPGTNMWQCAHMAIEETLNALAEPHLSTWVAEVCEDAGGCKHIEAVIQDLDDLPKGMKLYAAPRPAQAAMPVLTNAMRAVITNESGAYQSADDLYAALCAAAGDEHPAQADARVGLTDHQELIAMIDNNVESLGNVAIAADEKELAGLSRLLRKVGDTLFRSRDALLQGANHAE